MLRGYFDESGRPDGTFCVAGYVFPRGQAHRFQQEWRAMLPPGKIWHTSHVVQRTNDFSYLKSREDSQELLNEAAAILARTARFGVIAICNLAEMRPALPKVRGFSRAYPLCAHFCLAALGRHLNRVKKTDAVAYLFEQGDKAPQGDADALMHLVRRTPGLKRAYHYHSHGFAGKRDVALQAADFLAWQYGRFKGEHLDGGRENLREEFVHVALSSRVKHLPLHLTPQGIGDYLRLIEAYGKEIEADLAEE